jgi:histidine triad (HIT) family protein
MSDTCLFCRIVRREIPAEIVFETTDVLAFRDIGPKAPTHVLVIPKVHVPSLDAMDDGLLAGTLLLAAGQVARELGVAVSGYRTVINTNDDGGQTVHHLHLHVLGGRSLSWPPG